MNQQLKIKTKIRFQDALRYNLYIAYNNIINYIFLVLGIISLGMFIYSMINLGDTLDARFARSFALLIPPFMVFVSIPVKVWKATMLLLENPVLKDEVIYEFTKEKISLETSQGPAEVTWDSYVRIIETKHDFRFFMDKVQAQIIPKYSLSESEIKGIRHMVMESESRATKKLKRV